MKAKLVKLQNGEYDLLVDTNLKSLEGTKLSLKNCQAIEHGYDLDELAEEWVFETNGHKWSNNDDTAGDNYGSFKAGFQKALQLMGDKKFTEEDVRNIFAKTLENAPSMESHTRMISDEAYRHFVMDELYDKITNSLQKTEWDVEVEMETIASGSIIVVDHSKNPFEVVSETSLPSKEERPKLDAEGCLILKRVL